MGQRKRFQTSILLGRVLKVADDPKATQLLTRKEAENGLEIVIERTVEDIQGKEKRGFLNQKETSALIMMTSWQNTKI